MQQPRSLLFVVLLGASLAASGCGNDSAATANNGTGMPDASNTNSSSPDLGNTTDGGIDVGMQTDAGDDAGGDAGGDTGEPVEEIIECEPGNEVGESTRGTGTIEDPTVICSEAQLLAMVPDVGWYHVLGQDIVMAETYSAAVIAGEFNGDLNGQGFAIRGLTIDATSGNIGLFERFFGRVESLSLLDVSITSEGDSVGALAGNMNQSDAVDVTIQGVVSGRNFVGGMAGRTSGEQELRGLRFSGTVNGRFENVGGLFGQLGSGTLRDVEVQADVLALGDRIGGVAGNSRTGGDFEDVHFEGMITGNRLVGGIVGAASSPQYNRVSASGTMQTRQQSGGLIGSITDPRNTFSATIENSFVAMDFEPITGADEMHLIGGFIGNWGEGARIHNSYYAGTLRGSDLETVTFGGLAGQPRSINAINTFVAVKFELQNIVDLELDIIAPNTGEANGTNFWWDVDLSGESECHPQGNPDRDMLECNPANLDGSDPDYFSIPENEPMVSWDVGPDQPWSFDGGAYPVLNR